MIIGFADVTGQDFTVTAAEGEAIKVYPSAKVNFTK
jgi:hypothetical protein